LRRLGVSQETIDEMGNRGGAEVEPREAAALTFAEHMTLDARSTPEEVWTQLRQHFEEGEIVEVAAVAALFNGFNRFNDALEVEVTR
jgi:alkylhydroperoxidase family enzyme